MSFQASSAGINVNHLQRSIFSEQPMPASMRNPPVDLVPSVTVEEKTKVSQTPYPQSFWGVLYRR